MCMCVGGNGNTENICENDRSTFQIHDTQNPDTIIIIIIIIIWGEILVVEENRKGRRETGSWNLYTYKTVA